MKQVGQFITSDENQLATQLSQLEQNTVKETQSIRDSFDPSLVKVNATDGGTYTVGQTVISETPPAGIKILLSANRSGFLLLVNTTGNAIKVTPVSGTIDLGTTETFSVFTKLIFFDGTNWWAVG